MTNPTKNHCPICGSNIILRKYSCSSVGSSSSVLLGGQSSSIFYRCESNFDACRISVSIFDVVMERTNQDGRLSKNGKNWRDALIRRNHYDDFMEDHPYIKHKLLAIADKQLNINVDWQYLIPITE